MIIYSFKDQPLKMYYQSSISSSAVILIKCFDINSVKKPMAWTGKSFGVTHYAVEPLLIILQLRYKYGAAAI